MGLPVVPRLARRGLNDGTRFTGLRIAFYTEICAYGPSAWAWLGRFGAPRRGMGTLPMNEHGRGGHATSNDKDRPFGLTCLPP